MKKLIVSILLISALTVGCSRINNQNGFTSDDISLKNKEETLSQEHENQQTNHEEVIENSAPKNAQTQKKETEKLHPIDKAERDCIAKVYSTYDISQCSYKAMDLWFKEIDKHLGLLRAIMSEEDFANILKAQKDWEAYQNSEFEAIGIIMKKQGTMFQNVAVGKKTDLIKERALELKGLYDTLKFE